MRTVQFPSTPEQVEECLSLAAEGAIKVEEDGVPIIVIMPVDEYARLVELEKAAATDENPPHPGPETR